MRRVLCVYNTDYDAELIASSDADVSAVREAAGAVCDGIQKAGHDAQLFGVHGDDIAELIRELREAPPDLCFNICESLRGDTRNEIVVPALLDLFSVPYTGPSALGIALCLDKAQTKSVLLAKRVPTPKSLLIEPGTNIESSDFLKELEGLEYPYFLKLVREDASIGIEASNRVVDAKGLIARACKLMEKYKQGVLAERYIEGREVNVTLVGNGDSLRPMPLHEIDFSAMPEGRPKIVSYAAKWDESHVDYGGTVPVPMKNVGQKVANAIQQTAMDAFAALGLRDFGRVDIRVDGAGQPWVIDVNPNCDLSPGAGAARAAEAGGLDYPGFVGEICSQAWKRYQ